MVHKFAEILPREKWISADFRILPWLNSVPPRTPRVVDNDYDYTPYAAKPYALCEALEGGADVAILLDASFWLIRNITPLVEHIQRVGYYLCRNGSTVGEWSTDRCLEHFSLSREDALQMPDVSSYCVGIARDSEIGSRLASSWRFHTNQQTIAGPHTNAVIADGQSRNPGWCSDDIRVRGHRHDQTVLSIMAHRLGTMEWVARPTFTAYKGYETEETVLVCEGITGRF